ncbi:MAG: DUF4387 domain-containing protein [Ectothiorhodospiraceae bacterium]|nr:DUF4387 domain-containing protein [Ectothiorhodospiraceae bacterium]
MSAAPERLGDLARVVRSKNAGALLFTLDVMFADEATYLRVRDSGALDASRIATLYGVSDNAVDVIPYDVAWAIKVTIPRPVPSGDPADSDVYGAQQHAPLLDIEIP